MSFLPHGLSIGLLIMWWLIFSRVRAKREREIIVKVFLQLNLGSDISSHLHVLFIRSSPHIKRGTVQGHEYDEVGTNLEAAYTL